ncbi:MAG: AbrB/MazE/SpoVT family DNA-binding domain-containing protein [Myxococcota bacterium]|nr:AbrB/MazE/SpoVT family DNA-binding domain-containing protein [Myxococcota bacterium]
MKAIVSEKGQVTIPKAVRTRLGLVPGTVIDFDTKGGKLIGKKAEESEDPVLAVTGIILNAVDIDAYLDETRGPAE